MQNEMLIEFEDTLWYIDTTPLQSPVCQDNGLFDWSVLQDNVVAFAIDSLDWYATFAASLEHLLLDQSFFKRITISWGTRNQFQRKRVLVVLRIENLSSSWLCVGVRILSPSVLSSKREVMSLVLLVEIFPREE